MLKGKTVLLGVTGSIAAYKIANLASMLVKAHCEVHVIMTKNASNFINPITFETLTGHKCLIDTFDRNFEFQVEHVSLAQKADLVMVAPASADVLGKVAHGIADDMLTTTIMACPAKKVILSPTMNTGMYHNPILRENLRILKNYGYEILEPDTGFLACGDAGEGRMPEPEVLFERIIKELAYEKDMAGQKVMVTAGPTLEAIDPVRYITNHSTGKMGYAIARDAMLRGADVTLITGPVHLDPVPCVKMVPVISAEDMFQAVKKDFANQDILVMAAAVADYRPAKVSGEKIKKTDEDRGLMLERTRDILEYAGDHRREAQTICGFSMETEHVLESSRKKLEKKHLDFIAANNLKEEGAGFGTDTNRLTILTAKTQKELPLMSKEEAAHALLTDILAYKASI